jgi:hypothetical protein
MLEKRSTLKVGMSTMRRRPLGRVYAVYVCDSQPLQMEVMSLSTGKCLGNDIKRLEKPFEWV